jgi:hypothetical protein
MENLCSLRWHYPDQVKGLISARIIKAPQILCKDKRKIVYFYTSLYLHIYIYAIQGT